MKPIPYPLRGLWLITDEGADLVMQVWRTARETGKAERIALALEARDGEPFANERNCFVTEAGIAVMDIDGPLMRKAELLTDISGATSYQWIGATADRLRVDPSVKKVIIRSNSPGGEAAGCSACADKIAELAAEKHVEGWIETIGASAMYWLLSQCTHVTAHFTARAGWIGAVRRLVDDSEAEKKEGRRTIEFVSKGAEDKRTHPIDAAVKARVQAEVDTWGRFFTEAVARGRGVTTKDVLERFGRGEGMFAEAALEAGLIDAIDDFDSTLARLSAGDSTTTIFSSSRSGRAQQEDAMTMKQATTTTAAAEQSEWQCSGCNEMMGSSAKAYCAKCAEDDDDDDDDEDEAKALGLDAKATAAQRRERMIGLVALEERVFAATETKSHAAAMGRLAAVVADVAEVPTLRAELTKAQGEGLKSVLRATLERGLMGAPGKQPTLSLGRIQKEMATALRGEPKKAWRAAMDKLAVDAESAAKDPNEKDPAKKTISAAQIIDAACSVPVTADDVEAIREFTQTSAPVAAANYVEPKRNGNDESGEIEDETSALVSQYANKARAVLDRNKTPTPAK